MSNEHVMYCITCGKKIGINAGIYCSGGDFVCSQPCEKKAKRESIRIVKCGYKRKDWV